MSEEQPANGAAVLYVRKSNADTEGKSLDQQTVALKAHAEGRGWEVLKVLRETESAYGDRERPKFSEAMLLAEKRGAVLLVWALDRFSRKGAEDVLRFFPRTGPAPFRLVSLDGVDTSQEGSRLQTIIRAEVAYQESERIGSRIRRARADARSRRLWASGNAPYGYRVVGQGNERRLELVSDRAEIVVRMSREVLNGRPLRAIARGLNEDGVPPPNPRPRANGQPATWHPTSVRAILSNPATAGYLPRGTRAADSLEQRVTSYLKNDDGSPVLPDWPPLIEPAAWVNVAATLIAAKRNSPGRGNRHRKNPRPLLQGLLRCSVCGRSMVSRRWSAGRAQYACGSPDPVPNRRHVTASMDDADDFVSRAVVARLAVLASDRDPAAQAVADEWARLTGSDVVVPERRTVLERIDELRASRSRVGRMVADGLMPEEEGRSLLSDYARSLQDAESRLEQLPAERSVEDLGWLADLGQHTEDGDPLGRGSPWRALDVDSRRTIVASVVESVNLMPAGRSGGPHPSHAARAARYQIRWREAR